ncbi:unnamed protein product, partial [Iphiclides podalirius]
MVWRYPREFTETLTLSTKFPFKINCDDGFARGNRCEHRRGRRHLRDGGPRSRVGGADAGLQQRRHRCRQHRRRRPGILRQRGGGQRRFSANRDCYGVTNSINRY